MILKHSSDPDIEHPECSSIDAPRPLRHPSIDDRSSPTQKLETCAVPVEILFSKAALWEMDLSPGGNIVPRSFFAPVTFLIIVFLDISRKIVCQRHLT